MSHALPPNWRFPPHPEGSVSPLAQRGGLATVWDAALVGLRESLRSPAVAGVYAFSWDVQEHLGAALLGLKGRNSRCYAR